MTWGFIWLMFVLKIPIFMLLFIVWWAVRQGPEETGENRGDGGSRVHPHRVPPRRPKPGRRGPHGDPAVPSPRRTRTRVYRGRKHAA